MLASPSSPVPRRGFLARLGGALAALGVPGVAAGAASVDPPNEAWLRKLTGAHKVILHAHLPADGVAFGWAYNYLEAQRTHYGLSDRDSTVVIGFQGAALAFLLDDAMWAKYGMASALGVTGPTNPYRRGGPQSIAALQARGVILLACGNSVARGASRWVKDAPVTPERSRAWADEARAALHPGVEVVPAMVTTLVMAQERGCRYLFAG
jgi:intracellular sulfur oxidation DsrE/DsrF family protein